MELTPTLILNLALLIARALITTTHNDLYPNIQKYSKIK